MAPLRQRRDGPSAHAAPDHAHRAATVSHFHDAGARRGAVGEKYDDDCEWNYEREPFERIRPQLRLSDAIKRGWPPADYGQMLQWNQGGAELYSNALGGAVQSVEQTRRETESIVRATGDSHDAQLAAGNQVLGRLNTGINDFSEQLSRNRLLGAALNGEE